MGERGRGWLGGSASVGGREEAGGDTAASSLPPTDRSISLLAPPNPHSQ
ncbi:MAG: hypothetical protein KA202_00915 [Enterocloster sp.]|nr:hypothetical protein [Enterocloster clostridioformis]MBP6560492.1 hypothetical protein [Enterocloster sp.]MCA5576934.1 hypothetical protein [Enterocloster clostridioformis]MCI7608156.1 hypothetical protein [Enterocloster clostridioformis]